MDVYLDNCLNFTNFLEPGINTIISFASRLGNVGKTSNVQAQLLNRPMSEDSSN